MPAVDQPLVGGTRLWVRAEVAGALDHRREHRGLRRGELRDGNTEIRLGGGADAIGVVAEVDRVQVLLEDPLLGLDLRELLGDEDLLDLAAQCLRGADVVVEVPDQLLGDGGPALQAVAGVGEVVVGGAEDAGRRDAALVVEVLVLRRHHRIADRRRDLVVGEELPVGGAELAHGSLPVAEVHNGRLLQRRGRGVRYRGLPVGDSGPNGADHHHPAEAARCDRQRLAPGPVTPPVAAEDEAAAAPAPAPAAGAPAERGAPTRAPHLLPVWVARTRRVSRTRRHAQPGAVPVTGRRAAVPWVPRVTRAAAARLPWPALRVSRV